MNFSPPPPPWQSCFAFHTSVFCTTPGPYKNNTKLDYVVNKLGTAESTLTTQPINTRYQFRGGFIGDYTDIAAGIDCRSLADPRIISINSGIPIWVLAPDPP
jgi:hypothetical protein